MAKKLSYERYAWFHGRVKTGAFPWIAEQEWHEVQEVSVGKDGSLRLRFPVSGFSRIR